MVNANGGSPFPAGPSQPSTALALVLRTALWSGVSIALAAPAVANPKGGTVVGGAATISQPQTNVTQIKQTTSSAAINWQSFGIAPNETTVFQQPSSSSITLNRVIGSDPSVIAGHLVANGRLILVNQNGIAFSAGAQVDVNALIATPADIKTGDFMAGRLDFSAGSAKPGATVTNAGTITVADHGLAALVAPGVSNSGIINAKLGRVVLGGAESFAVDLYGDGMLSFDVGGMAGAARAGTLASMQVSNTGQINADGGRVLLTADTADAVVTGVVNLGGEINARAVGTGTGQVIADAGPRGTLTVNGRVDASGAGAAGGTVKLLGDTVALRSGAQIDASGDAGGGTILVGGNFHGAGSEPNATTTLVEGGAFLRADSRQSGDGGRIAVWSDLATTVAGTITARGGRFGGNGGFIETSGRQHLDVAGARIDTSAAKGKSGTWLLDPVDIAIDDSATSADLGAGPNFQSGGAQTVSDLNIADLNAALVNNDVVIDTHLGGTGPLGGQITVNAASAVAWSGHALTLNADSAIDIKTAISGGSGSSLNLTAGTAITQSASVAAGTVFYRAKGGGVTLDGNLAAAGDLTVAANGLLSIEGAFSAGSGKTIDLSGGGIALSGAVTTNAATVLDAKGQAYTDNGHLLATTNHNLSLTAGRVALTAPGTSLDSGSAAMTLAASSGEGLSAGTTVGGTLALSDGTLGLLHTSAGLTLATTGPADDISVDHLSAHANFGPLTVSAGRAVTFGASGSSFAGDVTARAAGAVSGVAITLAGDLAASGHAVDLTASAGRIEQTAGTITAARLSGGSVGGASFADVNAIGTFGSFRNRSSGDVTLRNGQALIVDGTAGAVASAGNITVTTTAGGLTLEGAIDAGDTVRLTGASGIALAADTTTNATTVLDTSGQTYTDNGHTLSTSGNPLFLATARVNLTAPTVSLDSGGAALTITAPSGTGASLGTLVAGTLNLSDAELGLIRAGTVTFQTSGAGDDIAVDHVAAHASFGDVVLDAARNLGFGPNGSGFAGNLLGNAGDIALAGNLTAAGKTVTLHARGRIVQSAGGIAAGLLTGSSGGDAIFAGNNAVDLGSFTIGGPGNFLFNSGRTLTINAPIIVPQGNLALSTTAGDLTLAADLTASGSAVVNVAGALRQTSGAISASSLIGSSVGGASLTDLNQIPLLLGFNNAGAGDVSIRDAGSPIVTGNYAAPGGNVSITASGALTLQGVAASAGNDIIFRSTGGFHLSGGRFSAGRGVILSTDGAFLETGLATFSTGYVAFDSTGAPLDLLQTFGPADPANSLIGFRTGTGNGPITIDTVSAPTATLLFSANSGAITAANIDVNRLAIAGSGGSASIAGTIHGANGQGAADFAVKSGAQDNFYKVNDCAVSTTNCIVVPRIVPVTPPSYGNFAIIAPQRQSDDSTLQAFSVGDEDLLQ